MKVRIELVEQPADEEVLIRCGRVDDTIMKIHRYIQSETQPGAKLTFYKDNEEFYFPLEEVLFFETAGEHIYAHTATDAYRIRHRLYELAEMLPSDFVRASKSTIINARQVYSITRNLTASSLVRFAGSHKQVYVSRNYYKALRLRLSPSRGGAPSG
ncbi:LytTR family DNA-binding domain-containing protein [Oscillospiraceae bacterium WX1]